MRGLMARTRPRRRPRGEVELDVVKMKSTVTDHTMESSDNRDKNIVVMVENNAHKTLKLTNK